jgi:hypothetical protein
MNFKAGLFTGLGAPVSLTLDLKLRLQRDSDHFFFDFNDNTFKLAGHVAIDLQMVETDLIHAPGWYWGNISDVLISGFNAGVYTVYINNAGIALAPAWHDIIEFQTPDLTTSILDDDLNLHQGAAVGRRNIGGILGSLAQSKFELREYVKASVPVPAQGIDAVMVARNCIQYQVVTVSYTMNWAVPDYVYYLLYHYDADRINDFIKPSDLPVW